MTATKSMQLVGAPFVNAEGEEVINAQIDWGQGYGVSTYALPVPHALADLTDKVQYIKALRNKHSLGLKDAKDLAELLPQWKPVVFRESERVVYRDVVKEVLPEVMKDTITAEVESLVESLNTTLQRMTSLARFIPVASPYGDNSNDYSASGRLQQAIDSVSSARWALGDITYCVRNDHIFADMSIKVEIDDEF